MKTRSLAVAPPHPSFIDDPSLLIGPRV